MLDLAVLQEESEAEPIDAAVVGDHRQVLHPEARIAAIRFSGNAAESKAPRHDGHAVEQHPLDRRRRVRTHLAAHGDLLILKGRLPSVKLGVTHLHGLVMRWPAYSAWPARTQQSQRR